MSVFIKKIGMLMLAMVLLAAMLICAVSLYRNVLFYIADCYPGNLLMMHHHAKLFIGVCLFNLALTKWVMGRWHNVPWLKMAALVAILGLMLSTLGSAMSLLLGGSLVVSGLLLSIPALVSVLAEAHVSYQKRLCLCVAPVVLLLINWGLLSHSQSFYAFREWCLALSMILALVTLSGRFVRLRQSQIA
jgi:hypothetical protein